MNTEQGGNKGAAPNRAGHRFEHEKQQHDGDAVQQDASEMVAAGVEPEKLAIQHVRNRRERMPVLRVNVGKRPRNSVQRDAARYNLFSVDVGVVVVIDEAVPKRLAKNQPRDRYEIYANENSLGQTSLCQLVLVHPKLIVRPAAANAAGKDRYPSGGRLPKWTCLAQG